MSTARIRNLLNSVRNPDYPTGLFASRRGPLNWFCLKWSRPWGPLLGRSPPIVPMPARASKGSPDSPVTGSVIQHGLSVEGRLAACESPGWLTDSVQMQRHGNATLINGVNRQLETKAQMA